MSDNNIYSYTESDDEDEWLALALTDASPPVRSDTIMTPKLYMFKGVVPYKCTATSHSLAIDRFIEDPQLNYRFMIAVCVCGVHSVYWFEMVSALIRKLKPFDMWLSKPASLSWIEIGQKIIPYVQEVYLPPIYPRWIAGSSYNQAMYLSHLSEFWDPIGDEYKEPWRVR